jgi:hypothetical protein
MQGRSTASARAVTQAFAAHIQSIPNPVAALSDYACPRPSLCRQDPTKDQAAFYIPTDSFCPRFYSAMGGFSERLRLAIVASANPLSC